MKNKRIAADIEQAANASDHNVVIASGVALLHLAFEISDGSAKKWNAIETIVNDDPLEFGDSDLRKLQCKVLLPG